LNPSGKQLVVGDQPGWNQVFADNFSSETVPLGAFAGCSVSHRMTQRYCSSLRPYGAVSRRWYAYPDGWVDHRYATYFPSLVASVANGMMDYYIHAATINGATYHMTAALVPKIPGGVNGGGLLYGRYEVRARFDSMRGYHVAFLLWPDSGRRSQDGEIDFPDDALDSTTIDGFLHWRGATSSGQFEHYRLAASLTQWHTYEIDWLPGRVSFYVDGTLIGTSTLHVPDTPMHWVLQTDTWSHEPPPANGTAGLVQVAWATAYSPA
jgi:hypothetical protein